jgi:hypothetical protein
VTNNFNGQMSGQTGIHSRFESDLFERFQSRLTIAPPAIVPVEEANAFIWDTILASNQVVPGILAADKAAAMGKSAYDDDYFEKFFTGVRPVLEQQLAKAITATASIIAGAWEKAGKPNLHQVPRQLERVR